MIVVILQERYSTTISGETALEKRIQNKEEEMGIKKKIAKELETTQEKILKYWVVIE